MPSTNFKIFDENKQNIELDNTYLNDADRLNGFSAGAARSVVFNKALYQTSIMAAALAQLVVNRGYNASDAVFNDLVTALNNALPSFSPNNQAFIDTPITVANNTIYQASTNGFLFVQVQNLSGYLGSSSATVYSDSNANPTTQVLSWTGGIPGGGYGVNAGLATFVPINKNNYYKVSASLNTAATYSAKFYPLVG